MTDPKKNKLAELAEDQLSEVTGGGMERLVAQLTAYKRCVANPDHVYPESHDACPI